MFKILLEVLVACLFGCGLSLIGLRLGYEMGFEEGQIKQPLGFEIEEVPMRVAIKLLGEYEDTLEDIRAENLSKYTDEQIDFWLNLIRSNKAKLKELSE